MMQCMREVKGGRTQSCQLQALSQGRGQTPWKLVERKSASRALQAICVWPAAEFLCVLRNLSDKPVRSRSIFWEKDGCGGSWLAEWSVGTLACGTDCGMWSAEILPLDNIPEHNPDAESGLRSPENTQVSRSNSCLSITVIVTLHTVALSCHYPMKLSRPRMSRRICMGLTQCLRRS